jgi:hypothetical protein
MAHVNSALESAAHYVEQYSQKLREANPDKPVSLATLGIEATHRIGAAIGVHRADEEMHKTLLSTFEPLEKRGRALEDKA